MARPKPVVVDPVGAERVAQQLKHVDWFLGWAREQYRNGADGTTPDDRPEGSDWNQHGAELNASGEALDGFDRHVEALTAGAEFHLPGEHDQRSHGRRGLPALDLDEHGIPVGFEVDLSAGGGWEDASEGEVAEFAQAAHRAGFTKMRFDPTIGGAIGAVSNKEPKTLLLDTRRSWDLERFDKISKSLGPYSTDQTFWMPQSHDAAPTSYLIDHESAHRIAFENGQHDAGYPRMKEAVLEVAADLGIGVGPGGIYEEDPRDPSGTLYVDDPDVPHRELVSSDLRDHFVDGSVQLALAKMGVSFKGTSGGMAEMYAELYAAWQGGSQSHLVLTVAEAEGWADGEV